MTESFQAIVLTCVRHSDKASVLTVYTPSRSCMTLIVPAGNSPRARSKAASRMPLALVEFTCRVNPSGEIQRPSPLVLRHPYSTLYFNPAKSALCMFLAEFLSRLLRDTPPDPPLFSYIDGALRLLDGMSGSPANFHLIFLSSLASLLGIAPDVSGFAPGRIFDMRAGAYVSIHPAHPDILTGAEARLPLILSRLTFSSMHRLRLNRHLRASILQGILSYYSLHLPPLGAMKSPEVLVQLFE